MSTHMSTTHHSRSRSVQNIGRTQHAVHKLAQIIREEREEAARNGDVVGVACSASTSHIEAGYVGMGRE